MNEHQEQELTRLVTKAIQDINTEPGLTAEQKKECIKQLGGLPRGTLLDYLNAQYRTAMEVADFIKQAASRKNPNRFIEKTKEAIIDTVKKTNKPKK